MLLSVLVILETSMSFTIEAAVPSAMVTYVMSRWARYAFGSARESGACWAQSLFTLMASFTGIWLSRLLMLLNWKGDCWSSEPSPTATTVIEVALTLSFVGAYATSRPCAPCLTFSRL